MSAWAKPSSTNIGSVLEYMDWSAKSKMVVNLRIELFKAYVKYEITLCKNLEVFLACKSYFLETPKLKYGISLDCWGLFNLKLGIEHQDTNSRVFIG